MSVKCRPTYTPLLYSKIGVYRDIHYFLSFALNINFGFFLEPPRVPTIYILSKSKNDINNYHFNNILNRCILHGSLCVINTNLVVLET